MRRIIGQCNQSTFLSIEHLAAIVENPDQLDVNTLSNTQKFAFRFLQMAIRKGISWKMLRKVVKEVLFWGEDDGKITGIQVKFIQKLTPEVKRFKELW